MHDDGKVCAFLKGRQFKNWGWQVWIENGVANKFNDKKGLKQSDIKYSNPGTHSTFTTLFNNFTML